MKTHALPKRQYPVKVLVQQQHESYSPFRSSKQKHQKDSNHIDSDFGPWDNNQKQTPTASIFGSNSPSPNPEHLSKFLMNEASTEPVHSPLQPKDDAKETRLSITLPRPGPRNDLRACKESATKVPSDLKKRKRLSAVRIIKKAPAAPRPLLTHRQVLSIPAVAVQKSDCSTNCKQLFRPTNIRTVLC